MLQATARSRESAIAAKVPSCSNLSQAASTRRAGALRFGITLLPGCVARNRDETEARSSAHPLLACHHLRGERCALAPSGGPHGRDDHPHHPSEILAAW